MKKDGRRSKAPTESASSLKARRSKLPESCEGQHRQEGREATGWISPCCRGLTRWLPFLITTWCLIRPNLSHYGSTCATSYQGHSNSRSGCATTTADNLEARIKRKLLKLFSHLLKKTMFLVPVITPRFIFHVLRTNFVPS